MLRPWLILVTISFVLLRCLVSPSRIVIPAGARSVLLLPGIMTDYQWICDILLVGYYWCHLLLFVIGFVVPTGLLMVSSACLPMWESAKTVAPTPNSAIIQLDVDDNFVINSTHLNMIQKNKFDGYLRADPHDHIREFLAICNMFRYGETQSEAVKLLIFHFSLCDKAKTWFNELNEESITSWEQMRRAFINRFFPPSLFNRLLLEIINFSQLVCESLTDAWLRLKNMLRKCHGH
ncbi:reverse transcriptase domain-containing protein, partial [Tanacetum coccineum]